MQSPYALSSKSISSMQRVLGTGWMWPAASKKGSWERAIPLWPAVRRTESKAPPCSCSCLILGLQIHWSCSNSHFWMGWLVGPEQFQSPVRRPRHGVVTMRLLLKLETERNVFGCWCNQWSSWRLRRTGGGLHRGGTRTFKSFALQSVARAQVGGHAVTGRKRL